MSIKDIISRKPRWQHSDPTVRIEAIDTISDQDILTQLIADDPDEKVKCAAINQLLDFHELSRLATQPGQIGTTARIQFCRRLEKDPPSGSGTALISSLENVELLKEIAMSSNGPDITLLALEQLNNEELLIEIACAATTTQVRESAARKVQSAANLELLQKKARHKDKLVHNLTKARLQELQRHASLKQQNFDDAEAIINELGQLPGPSSQSTSERMINHLQTKWDAVEPGFQLLSDETDRLRADQLKQSFSEAMRQCHLQMQTLQKEREAESNALANARLISGQLGKLLADAHDGSTPLDACRQVYDELTNQWHALHHLSLPLEIKEAYYSLISKLEFLLDSHKRWGDLKAQLTSIETARNTNGEVPGQPVEALPAELVDKIMNFHWPEDFPVPDDLVATRESIKTALSQHSEQTRTRQKDRAEVEAKLDKMADDVKAGHLRAATRLKRQLAPLVNDLNDHRLHERLQRISAELTELRDWQGFATRPKREELCQKMEDLAGLSLHPTDKADQIKALHAEWKLLGDSHSDQKHWHRFKQASDMAYEPCKIYFQQQAQERAQRLQDRVQICQQLEEFNQAMDWESADWKALMEIISTARKQWRDLGPVDHAHRKSVQNRFYKVLDALNEHLTTEQNRNRELKRQLIEAVTLQLDQEEDLHQAIKRTIELQKEWKQIGVMDRKVDQKLWKKFRKVCDAVFSRRDEQRQTEKDTEIKRMAEAEAFCQSMEELVRLPLQESRPSKSKLTEFQAQFRAIELSGPMKKRIEHRFSSACENYQASISAFSLQKKLGSIEELANKARICQQLERQIEADEISDGARLALWTTDGDLPAPLAQRIKKRWEQATDLMSQPPQVRQQVMADNAAAGRLICIRLEILAGLESPSTDQQLRMSYQVDRLKRELSMGEKELRSTAEQLRALQEDWYCLGAIPATEFDELSPRVEAALKNFKN